DVGHGVPDGRILAGVVGKQPDLPELLVRGRVAGAQVGGAPVERRLTGLSRPRDPELDVAMNELVVHARAGSDMDLERHPLTRRIAEAIAVRREVARWIR